MPPLKIIFCAIFYLLTGGTSFCQDIHFSQFYASALTLNPAATGDYKGDWRISNSFRRQWSQISPGYLTNAFGFDKPVYLIGEKFSAGINIITDKSGLGALFVTKANLSVAWHRVINKHSLHVGYQAGYVSKSLDVSQLTFPDQFNQETGAFDNNLNSFDDRLNDHFSFIDMNAGISWSRKTGRITPKLGFALFHINKPNDSFYKKNDRLAIRNVISFGLKWEITNQFYIHPDVLFMEQSKANNFVGGIRACHSLADNTMKMTGIYGGLHVRNNFGSQVDAAILTGGLNFKSLDVGISYDVNISSLQPSTKNKGAFEVSIIYTALSTRLVKLKIPCDRY